MFFFYVPKKKIELGSFSGFVLLSMTKPLKKEVNKFPLHRWQSNNL